jgi:hypothetical protein
MSERNIPSVHDFNMPLLGIEIMDRGCSADLSVCSGQKETPAQLVRMRGSLDRAEDKRLAASKGEFPRSI